MRTVLYYRKEVRSGMAGLESHPTHFRLPKHHPELQNFALFLGDTTVLRVTSEEQTLWLRRTSWQVAIRYRSLVQLAVFDFFEMCLINPNRERLVKVPEEGKDPHALDPHSRLWPRATMWIAEISSPSPDLISTRLFIDLHGGQCSDLETLRILHSVSY